MYLAVGLALVVLLAVLAISSFLVMVEPAAWADVFRVAGVLAAIMIVVRCLNLVSPRRVTDTYEYPDLSLLVTSGARPVDIVAARVMLPALLLEWLMVLIGLVTLAVVAAVSPGLPVEAIWILVALLFLPILGTAARLLSLLILAAANRAGIPLLLAIIVVDLAVPVLLSVGILIFGLGIVGELTPTDTTLNLVQLVVANSRLDLILAAFASHSLLSMLAAVAVLVSFVGIAVVQFGWNTDVRQTQQRLKTGLRLRTRVTFSHLLPVASADKDARLLTRRGLPAWDTLDGLVTAIPVILALSTVLVTAGLVGLVPDDPRTAGYIGAPQILALMTTCLILGVLLFVSDSLTAFLSLDTDGPVQKLLRGHGTAFADFLASRSSVGALVLASVGTLGVVAVHWVMPWPGLAVVAVLVVVCLASAVEALVVCVGTALRPALFRPEVGLPPIEPSVRLISGVALGLVVTLSGPLIVVASHGPQLHPLLVVLLAPVLVAGTGFLVWRAAPTVFSRSERPGGVTELVEEFSYDV